MAIGIEIFDIKTPIEKTKTGEFNTKQIMFRKEYGVPDEALKKVSEKQYSELAFVWDTLINYLDNWKGDDRWENGNYIYPSDRLTIFGGEATYHLNLNRVKMWWNVKMNVVKVTLDYQADNAEELRRARYHEIHIAPAKDTRDIGFLCDWAFPTSMQRSIELVQDQYREVADTYIIDAGNFIDNEH